MLVDTQGRPYQESKVEIGFDRLEERRRRHWDQLSRSEPLAAAGVDAQLTLLASTRRAGFERLVAAVQSRSARPLGVRPNFFPDHVALLARGANEALARKRAV